MTRLPTVLTVSIDIDDDGAIGLETQKLPVPAGVELTPAANPSDPYRQDGVPAYPDQPPYAVRCNDRDEALRIAHDLFAQNRVNEYGSGVKKRVYEDHYLKWVNNMTNLSVAIDEVETAIPWSAQRRRKHSTERVYREVSLATPKWIVYIGDLQWEDDR